MKINMSGKDVVHLLIILGVGGYSFIGSMTESGLGGWMNDAQLVFFETYSVEISVLLAIGLVSVLTLLVEIVWNIVSGSKHSFEQSMSYRLLFGANAPPVKDPASQDGVIPPTAEREKKPMRDDPRLPKASDFPTGTTFVIKEFDVPLAYVPSKGWFNWYGGSPRPYDVTGLKPGNNWAADSFEQWLGIVEASLKEHSVGGRISEIEKLLPCCGLVNVRHLADLPHVYGFDFDLYQCGQCARYWVYVWRSEASEGWEEATVEDAKKMQSLGDNELRAFMKEWARSFD
jgi:hypothetical protein